MSTLIGHFANFYRNQAQPCFLAYVSSTINNVTGDGTVYTIIFDSEEFDINGDFNTGTGTFTAPVDGKYIFHWGIRLEDLAVGHTVGYDALVTSIPTTYYCNNNNVGAIRDPGNNFNFSGSAIVALSATNTVVLKTTVSNGAKVVDVGGAATYNTWLGGALLF